MSNFKFKVKKIPMKLVRMENLQKSIFFPDIYYDDVIQQSNYE